MTISTRFTILLLVIIVVTRNEVLGGNVTSCPILSDEDLANLRQIQANGISYLNYLTQLEAILFANGFRVKDKSQWSDMAKFKQPSRMCILLSRENIIFGEIIRLLKDEVGLTFQDIQLIMQECTFGFGCLPNPVCPKADKYRTIDGSCNSLVKNLGNLGRSITGYRRLLNPAYDNGFSSPRKNGVGGSVLPSPRLISTKVFSNTNKPLKNSTVLLMQFGQLINHDMEFTTQFTFDNGVGFTCCGGNNSPLDPTTLSSLVHCMPITVPVGDPQLGNSKEACMNFVRSSTGPNRLSCYSLSFLSYDEQLNQNTHWLDASTVYGSNTETMNSLREPLNGLLKTSLSSGRQQLPLDCSTSPCLFNAGDSRVNEQPQLTVIHTIWHREHNRIAKVLVKLNPKWNSETIFQESRRIVIAELQHITYNEFLPNLLGASGMARNTGLWPLPGSGTIPISNKLISGPVSNEFATAAFRMGHSLIQGTVQLYDAKSNLITYNMKDVFNNPLSMFSDPNFFDNAIRGLVSQSSQTVDTHIVDDLRFNLFQKGATYLDPVSSGILDIVALNIQRGRDHGLPSYNSYRKYCGLPLLTGPIGNLPTKKTTPAKVSDPIIPYFDPAVVKSLASVYKSVDDIDLFVGGIAEINPLEDILIGPTFMCIIAENFKQVKVTDRYFYESAANPYPFTSAQLIQIKKAASMARILCDNSDGSVVTMQPKAFAIPGGTNPKVKCTDTPNIPVLNLTLWKV